MILHTIRREPALLLGLVGIVIKASAAFGLEVNAEQQTLINVVVATLVGVILAAVAGDGVAAAVLGLIQAVLALAVGFGLDWSADQQAYVMSFAAAIVAMYDRTQLTAPEPARPAPKPAVR